MDNGDFTREVNRKAVSCLVNVVAVVIIALTVLWCGWALLAPQG